MSAAFHSTCVTELSLAEVSPLARVSGTAVETNSARVHASEILAGSSSPVAAGMKLLCVGREDGLLISIYVQPPSFSIGCRWVV